MLNNIASFLAALNIGIAAVMLVIERDITLPIVFHAILAVLGICISEWTIAKERAAAEARRIRALENEQSEWNKIVKTLHESGYSTTDGDRRKMSKTLNDGSEVEVRLVDEHSPATRADGKYWGPRV